MLFQRDISTTYLKTSPENLQINFQELDKIVMLSIAIIACLLSWTQNCHYAVDVKDIRI